MFKNYFKTAWRNLLHNKSFSFINVSGLAIGMACAALILLWIGNEISHDRFFDKQGSLYEVWSNDKINGTIRSLTNTPEIMVPSLKNDYPEIEAATRVQWTRNLFTAGKGEKKLMLTGAVVDDCFLTMFNFPLVSGKAAMVLTNPYSIVVTEKMAKELFNTNDVVGKIIKMGGNENYVITGVLKNLPDNTQFNFAEYLCSYNGKMASGGIDSDWTDISVPTYVLLKPNTSPSVANAKIKNIIPQHTGGRQKTEEFLYPVSKLWLYSQFENGKVVGGRITMVKTFSIIAFFILLIACINFMNLSTARSESRAKEVGIRKVSGALKGSLVIQFIGESVLISFIAGLFAFLLVQLSLPAFNQLTGKQLALEYSNIYFWIYALAFILFTGVIAGSYPAFFLSSIKPASILKNKFKKTNVVITPRKVLVVLQFTFATTLIICTIIVTQQIKFGEQRNIGYNPDHLVHIFLNDEMQKNFELIKNDLVSSRIATSVSMVQSPPTDNWSSGIGFTWQGKNPSTVIQINRYAEWGDLVKTAGMQLLQGRDIDRKRYAADSSACIINEAALKLMNFKNPVGQLIKEDGDTWHVVGVIKDFIQESPYQPIKPLLIKGSGWMGAILVRLNGYNPTTKNIAGMEKIFNRYNPAYPFEYSFTDDVYDQKFADDQLTQKIAELFASLNIFIACLGLFGLSAYMAQNRRKEIGVRKILGAKVRNIAALLSQDFIKLVAIAIIISSPVAWWVMNKWLQNFTYRISISWWMFAIAGLLAIVIALATVSFQAIKAAIANPVKSLRTE